MFKSNDWINRLEFKGCNIIEGAFGGFQDTDHTANKGRIRFFGKLALTIGDYHIGADALETMFEKIPKVFTGWTLMISQIKIICPQLQLTRHRRFGFGNIDFSFFILIGWKKTFKLWLDNCIIKTDVACLCDFAC